MHPNFRVPKCNSDKKQLIFSGHLVGKLEVHDGDSGNEVYIFEHILSGSSTLKEVWMEGSNRIYHC